MLIKGLFTRAFSRRREFHSGVSLLRRFKKNLQLFTCKSRSKISRWSNFTPEISLRVFWARFYRVNAKLFHSGFHTEITAYRGQSIQKYDLHPTPERFFHVNQNNFTLEWNFTSATCKRTLNSVWVSFLVSHHCLAPSVLICKLEHWVQKLARQKERIDKFWELMACKQIGRKLNMKTFVVCLVTRNLLLKL